MAAVSSESVDTITAVNRPLSSAGAIVYAMTGCPWSIRTFFPGTRLEPWRAGISATAEGRITNGDPEHEPRNENLGA
jgi:hypothetical protein